MKIDQKQISAMIAEKGLKITPQRVVILEAVYALANHPTAEQIIEYINKKNAFVATGTVYKVLDTFVEHDLINRVKTDKDVMRYDGRIAGHHHLYCSECELIKDYVDEELDEILSKYFAKKDLPEFDIDSIVLQIRGKFNKCLPIK